MIVFGAGTIAGLGGIVLEIGLVGFVIRLVGFIGLFVLMGLIGVCGWETIAISGFGFSTSFGTYLEASFGSVCCAGFSSLVYLIEVRLGPVKIEGLEIFGAVKKLASFLAWPNPNKDFSSLGLVGKSVYFLGVYEGFSCWAFSSTVLWMVVFL